MKATLPQHIKLDEREHVEKPLLEQLAGLGWEVIDLTDMKQTPTDTHRESFTEVVMTPVLRQRLKVINPWLEDNQVEEVVKQLTASFPSTGLLENNKHLFQLLLENTSVSENRQSGEKSPTVRFADFAARDNNRFIAVCQFKVRVLGTEHHIIPDVVLFLNGLPVAVIECKSSKVKDAIPEAIDQLLRYSEQRGAKEEGMRRSSTTTSSSWRPAGRKPSSAPSPRTRRSTSTAGPTRIHKPWTNWATAQAAPTTSSVSSPACSTGTTCST